MIEYSVLIIIILAVFLTMGSYVKIGIAGRWKSTADDMGDQYDPRVSKTDIKEDLSSNTVTDIQTQDSIDGFWTFREDTTNSLETKQGVMSTGDY